MVVVPVHRGIACVQVPAPSLGTARRRRRPEVRVRTDAVERAIGAAVASKKSTKTN